MTLRGKPQPDTTLTHFYRSHYNLIDRIDKGYYAIFHPTHVGSWEKVLTLSILIVTLQNAWVLQEEHKATLQGGLHGHSAPILLDHDVVNFPKFLLELVECIEVKYKKGGK